MIQLDKSLPIATQLADHLRYEIASGRYRAGETMPSTRELARRLDISFHTVRKVYRQLEDEGLLSAKPGAGYVVVARGPYPTEDRIERGAAIAQEALKKMLGLGLSEEDIAYLFEEQQTMLDSGMVPSSVVIAAGYLELAEECADQLANVFHLDAQASLLSDLEHHTHADYVLVGFPDVRHAMHVVPGADVIGIKTSLPMDVLDTVARLSADSTLALVVRDIEAAPPLMQELRAETAFGGPMVSMAIDERSDRMTQRLREAELVIATPACARRLRGRLPEGSRLYLAAQTITTESMDRLRSILPE